MTDDENGRRGLGLAAMVIGAVVVLGLILGGIALLGGNDDPDPAPTTTSSAPTAQSDSDSVCGLKGHETSGTLNRAPEADWQLVNKIAVPTVEGSGPGTVEDDGFRYCYARTPEGALLFSANFLAMGSDPRFEERLVEHLLAPGPGRERAQTAAGQGRGDAEDSGVQVAGFRMKNYTDEEATVDVLMQVVSGGGSAYAYQQFDLRWTDGDWRLITADDGGPRSDPQPVPDAAGFIPWSGV